VRIAQRGHYCVATRCIALPQHQARVGKAQHFGAYVGATLLEYAQSLTGLIDQQRTRCLGQSAACAADRDDRPAERVGDARRFQNEEALRSLNEIRQLCALLEINGEPLQVTESAGLICGKDGAMADSIAVLHRAAALL